MGQLDMRKVRADVRHQSRVSEQRGVRRMVCFTNIMTMLPDHGHRQMNGAIRKWSPSISTNEDNQQWEEITP